MPIHAISAHNLRRADWSGAQAQEGLIEAWRVAHYAAQAAAEVGKSWGVAQPDDGHSSFHWDARLLALVGVRADGQRPCRGALRMATLELALVDDDGQVLDAFELAGSALTHAAAWIRDGARRFTGAPERQPARPAPVLPRHAIADGAAFPSPADLPLGALCSLYDDAARTFSALSEQLGDDASDVQCWPHHFDIATLAIVGRDGDGAMTKTIGVGLTPPDDVVNQPYMYVSPWSNTGSVSPKKSLTIGRWRGAMAVLPLDVLAAANNRADAASAFLAESFNACLDALS